MGERQCEACRSGVTFRRHRCRRCWRLLCIFCRQAPCAGDHRGHGVILDAISAALTTGDGRP
jgi:hypothetical protein